MALQLSVVVQVLFPAAIVQGLGEALIEPVWAKSCGAARTGHRTQSIQAEIAGSLFTTMHHQGSVRTKGCRTFANPHVMLVRPCLSNRGSGVRPNQGMLVYLVGSRLGL